MNKKLFKALLAKNGDTQKELAASLGISLSNLNAKINSTGASFRQTEILAIKTRYHMTPEEVDTIFLTRLPFLP